MPNPTKVINQSIVLASLPVNTTDAANKQYVDNIYNNAIQNAGGPGMISFFARNTPPTGWIKANGAVLAITGPYNALFNALPKQGNGNTIWWRAGDGAANFRIPDLRGVFVRGWADPDTANGAGAPGYDAGRTFGDIQQDAYKNHTHTITDPGHTHIASGGPYAKTFTSTTAGPNGSAFNQIAASSNPTIANSTTGITINTSTTGGSETRPLNIALLACIQF
jgi:microcystin-dependent protein